MISYCGYKLLGLRVYYKQHKGSSRRILNYGELAGLFIVTKGDYTWQNYVEWVEWGTRLQLYEGGLKKLKGGEKKICCYGFVGENLFS